MDIVKFFKRYNIDLTHLYHSSNKNMRVNGVLYIKGSNCKTLNIRTRVAIIYDSIIYKVRSKGKVVLINSRVSKITSQTLVLFDLRWKIRQHLLTYRLLSAANVPQSLSTQNLTIRRQVIAGTPKWKVATLICDLPYSIDLAAFSRINLNSDVNLTKFPNVKIVRVLNNSSLKRLILLAGTIVEVDNTSKVKNIIFISP